MIYRFSDFSLDTEGFELKAGSAPVAIEPQVFSLLQTLIENRDRVVSKDELIEAVWDGRIVSDAALTSCVNAARRAVGDDGKTQATIRTYPRRGFRFVADMGTGDGATPDANARQDQAADPGQLRRPAIAVLAFDNLSGDPEQEFFSEGITEDIISALTRLPQFMVIERNSTLAYKGLPVDVRTVARELDVAYVVEGSVRKAGNRVRISAQLIDAASRNPIWAEKYDRDLDDIFAIQDEITRHIVAAIEPQLLDMEWERVKARPIEDLDMWETYHRALGLIWDRTGFGKPDQVATAKALFGKVIERDPDFGPAYAGLAICYFASLMVGDPEDREAEKEEALAAGRRAVALAGDSYVSHMGLGLVHIVRREHEAAIERLRIAIGLNPSAARAHYALGQALVLAGRGADAVQHLETGLRLSPHDLAIGPMFVRRAEAHYQLGEFEQAEDLAARALRSTISQIWANCILTATLGKLGRTEDAAQALADLLARRPDMTLAKVRATYPASDQAYLEDYLDGLRRAGLPE